MESTCSSYDQQLLDITTVSQQCNDQKACGCDHESFDFDQDFCGCENTALTIYTEETSSETIKRDAEFWASYVRAAHPDTPFDILAEYAESADHTLRRRVAENVRIPALLQIQLLQDRHVDVRLALAENPSVPLSLLQFLAGDESAIVRYDIADNPHLPIRILMLLVNDDNAYVAHRARSTVEKLLGFCDLANKVHFASESTQLAA
jgi:hypothetical protein